MQFAGLDIGGANLKFASTTGEQRELPFAFWKHKKDLAKVLNRFRDLLSPDDLIGVTMTAELADCFESKKEGVSFIVDTVCNSFCQHEPLFYRTDGTMCDHTQAKTDWRLVAASNWHALAWLAFRNLKQNSGFVFDIGSTTTDIIPVCDGLPVSPGQNDFSRLRNGQLFYAGVGRTPICSILNQIEFDGQRVGIAREIFATSSDAFTVLKDISADDQSFETADGRSRSYHNSVKRIARMVCVDQFELGENETEQLAKTIASQVKTKLINGISDALLRVVKQHQHLPKHFVTFGGGAWLAREILEIQKEHFGASSSVRSFSDNHLSNQTAPAFAVAKKREEVFQADRI